MLQYFTPDILLFFAGQRTGYIIGNFIVSWATIYFSYHAYADYHKVFVNYARDQIKGPLHLNTQITKIGMYYCHVITWL
jgi:hypothetical protein